MILHTTLVVILFLSSTISKPRPCVNEEAQSLNSVDEVRSAEGSSEGSGDDSEALEMRLPRSGEGSGEFLILEDEMGSGMDSELLGRLAEEEEMTTESEMINNLVPRFDLEMGSGAGDGEEFFKMSSEEEEGSGAGVIFKITTEEVTEGSGAEFRFDEVSDEVGSGDDSTENVRLLDIVEEIVEITTEVAVRQAGGFGQ